MFPTIKDVAERAGVSPSTVSRVIADHPRISRATKERVRAVMRELNYHPNAVARSLVRRRTQTIGVALSRSAEAALANPSFPEVLRV
ncbi:MAG: LacI family DNA-binding transcriptional regulator, partial [Limnochordales bacterium]